MHAGDKQLALGSFKTTWWQWPTILSLDAPLVAWTWQIMISRVCDVNLDSPRQLILGISIWLAYITDRWIEAYRLRPDQIHTNRLMFYHKHKWITAVVWVLFFSYDLLLAFHNLYRNEFIYGLYLFTAVVLYLLSHQWLHRNFKWRLPKEVCVALILGAGVGFFIALALKSDFSLLGINLSLFVLLCFTNCILISIWEKDVDTLQGQDSLARQFKLTEKLGKKLPFTYALITALLYFIVDGLIKNLIVCVFISLLSLFFIDLLEPKYGRSWARVFADVALLTPLPFIVYWYLLGL